MKEKSAPVLLIFIVMTLSVQHVNASTPQVDSISASREGDDVFIRIEIVHSGWSEDHYVDLVEATMNGRALNFTDLETQNAYRLSLNGTFFNCEIGELRVRARCVTHGWSRWVKTVSTGVQAADRSMPDEPTWSPLVALLTMASLVVLMKWRKIIP